MDRHHNADPGKHNRGLSRAVVCGITVGALLSGCGLGPSPTSAPEVNATPAETATSTPQPTPTPFKPELVICTRSEPDTLVASSTPASAAISALVTGQVVTYDTAYQAQPDLLQALPGEADGSLRKNDDGTITVTLRYRDGLKWSDGEPFKAADAVLGLRAASPPGMPVADVVDVQEGDGGTVTVRLAEGAQYPYVPSQPPLPMHKLATVNTAQLALDPYARLVNPSLGPYFVAEWAAGDHILLQANLYSDPAPVIPVVRIRFIADSNQVVTELSSGGCDVVLDDALGIEQLAALDQAAGGNTVHEYKFSGSTRDEIVFNTATGAGGRVPFFASVPVRQAVAYGFDRAAAVQQMYGGLSTPLDGWLPAEHWAAGGGGFGSYTLDASKSTALLEQDGWRDEDGDGIREYHGTGGDYSCQRGSWIIADKTPLTPTLILADNDPRRVAFAQQLQAALKPIGIGLQVQAGSAVALFSVSGPVQRREFDAALISLATAPDPDGISQWVGADVFRQPLDKTVIHRWQLEQRWVASEQLVERLALNNIPSADNDWQGQNYAGWCNEQADLTAVQASLGFDLNARKAQYGQLATLIAGDSPMIPLAYRPRLAASKSYVCGIQPIPFEPLTWNAATWYFEPQGACAP